MRIQSFTTAFELSGLLVLLCIARPVFASSDIVLADILDAKGQISNPAQLSGSVDFSGYYPVIDEYGLRFLPAPPSTWVTLGSGTGSTVQVITINGSNVYVGGSFTNAAGIPEADRIAVWNHNTNTWSAMGSGFGNGTVFTIAVSGSDVYAGGNFTGTPGYFAQWDGTAWVAASSLTLDGGVRDIVISGNEMFIAGNFTSIGITGTSKIAYWNGSQWSGLNANLSSVDVVNAIDIIGNDIYFAGQFTTVSGVSGTSNIAKWNKLTQTWSALQNGLNSSVFAMTVSGTDVYTGGNFTDAGNNPNADRIARWSTVDNSWNALGNTAAISSSVLAVAVSGNQVFVGGTFFNASGDPSYDFMVSWNGNSWDGLGAGFDGSCRAITIDGTGSNIYFGGQFTSANGNTNGRGIAILQGAALPVELLSFRAHPDTRQVLLTWHTASEHNNLGWDIERSADGRQWQTLGSRAGQGTTSEPQVYTFTDDAPLPERNYYRLRQSDHDGKYEYSEVAQVMMAANGQQTCAFYPNPAHSGLVNLDYYAEKEGDLSVSVFDALGRLMIHQNQPLNAERKLLQFDFSQLAPGTYSVLLNDGTSQVNRTITIQ